MVDGLVSRSGEEYEKNGADAKSATHMLIRLNFYTSGVVMDCME